MGAMLSAAVGYLLLGSLALSLGAAAGRWLIVPRVASDTGPSLGWLERRSASLGTTAAALLAIALLLVLVRQFVEFRDPFAPLREDLEILLGTGWARRGSGEWAARYWRSPGSSAPAHAS